MTQLRASGRRLITLPAVWLLAGAVALAAVAVSTAQAAAVKAAPDVAAAVSIGDAVLAQVIFLQAAAAAAGALVTGPDLPAARLARLWLASPSRTSALAAQALVALLAGVAVGCIGIGSSALGWWLGGGPIRLADDDAQRCLGALIWLGLVGVLAHAATVLTRSMLAGIGSVVALLFVVEPLVQYATRAGGWLPGLAGRQLYLVVRGEPDVVGVDPLLGIGIATTWVLGMLALAVLVERHRDVG